MLSFCSSLSVGAVLLFVTAGEASQPAASSHVQQIKSIIQRSYELGAIAARNFDVSQFASVYANDSAYPLTSDQKEFVNKIFPDSGNRSGMLTYMTAYYANWQLGAERLEQLQAKAKSEGRELTVEDLQKADGIVGPPRRTDPIYKTNLRFDDITVTKNRAEVIFDDGAATQRMNLVRTPNGWRIVAIELLSAHF